MNTEERVSTGNDYLALLSRRWPYPAVIIPAALLLAVYLAYALPATFRSTSTIMLEASSIPEDLIRTTVTTYADQQFELVRRNVITRGLLTEVVGRVDPYPDRADLSAEEKAQLIAENTSVERVDPITLEPLLESTAFSIHYDNPDPQIAAAIALELGNLFLTYNRQTRAEQAGQAYEFLSSQSKQLERALGDLDKKMATFKSQNVNALPADVLRNEDALGRRQSDLEQIQAEARLVEQREAMLAQQLSQLSPTLRGAVKDPRAEIARLQQELADAELRYTPDHPTVRRLQKSLEALLVQAGNPVESGAGAADNPEYLRVSAELSATRRQLAGLRSSAGRAQADIANYRSRLLRAPNVEPEYQQLERERQVVQGQLEQARLKLREAFFAQQFEAEQRGQRYTLIRSPYPADKPYSPNRLGIILLGLVIGAGLALGLAVLVDVADPTVRGSADVRDLIDSPIIGSIPLVYDGERNRRQRRIWAGVGACFLIASVVVAVTVSRELRRESSYTQEVAVETAE